LELPVHSLGKRRRTHWDPG